MFHIRTGLITGIVTLLCVSVQSTPTYANGPASPVAQSQPAETSLLADVSLADLRQGTKAKISGTQQWVKDQTALESAKGFVTDLEQATDRLQADVAPLGRSIKTSVKDSLPGQSLAQKGDKTFSVFGLLLMLAFGFVFMMMSLSGPTSRLGGRH